MAKTYPLRLSALQIQALVKLENQLGTDWEDPILQSVFNTANKFWTEEVIPAEMGTKPKRVKAQPTQAEVIQANETLGFEALPVTEQPQELEAINGSKPKKSEKV